ncbi:MAG: MATE family efflux transporter [Planctomycetota bacterium]|nr:MATE family efflux transporter [Planctomycetota bacterium]
MDRTKRALTTALKFSVLYCTVCFLPLMFFPRHIIGAFGDDPALGTVGGPALRIIVLAMPIIGLQVIGASLFQALGKAFAAMFLSTSRQVLFLVPLILILPHYMGIDGVWWAFPIADVSATVITMFWVRFQVCEFDNRDCGPPGVGT